MTVEWMLTQLDQIGRLYAHGKEQRDVTSKAQAKKLLEYLIAWLDSDCTGHPVLLGFGSPRKRRKCELCWREFKESVK